MIAILAWRNVWRNKTRSMAVILALTMGLFGALFISAMSNGMVNKWISNAIENEISELQIHDQQYLIMEELGMTMDVAKLEAQLNSNANIASYCYRIKTEAMAMTANNNRQVTILGIDPQQERQVTGISNQLIEGKYLETTSSFKPILVSQRLADKLKIRLKSKIVFALADQTGNVVYDNFKVNGIFHTDNSLFDNVTVFVRQQDLADILKIETGQVHEVAVRLTDLQLADQTKDQLSPNLPDYKTETWKRLNPQLELAETSMSIFSFILIGIVLIALIFGIINTMLMAILERTKEIGMLRSLGMRRSKIATMITLETIFLCLVGGILGNVLGMSFIEYFGSVGMSFEEWKEGFEQFGISAELYPTLDKLFYIQITVMVVVTAVFSSIFPIIRAFKLDPASAIRD